MARGVLWPCDARRAVDEGVDGVVVSNHGGRELDHVPASIDAINRQPGQDRQPPLAAQALSTLTSSM
jgi:methylmalonyl-CoA mutase cobalamin-binding subunit